MKIREGPYLYLQLKSVPFTCSFLVADEECLEETIEGHAVVHLDANILHRIKQEPVDCNETQEYTCVTFKQDSENPLEEILSKLSTSDEGNLQIQTTNGNQENEVCSLQRENQESLEGDDQSHVTEASASLESASSVTDTSGVRRSSRQRHLVQRLNAQQKEKASTDCQTQSPEAQPASNPRNLFRGVPGRDASSTSQRVPPNAVSSQTCDIINDESDFFKRRFRKV